MGARRINANANGLRDRQPHQEPQGLRPRGGGPPSLGGSPEHLSIRVGLLLHKICLLYTSPSPRD
eukprot:10568452-Alexandrium_andersonii.AAC.1